MPFLISLRKYMFIVPNYYFSDTGSDDPLGDAMWGSSRSVVFHIS